MFLASADQPGLTDDAVLDQFTIPFGSWIEEAVNWTTLNLDWILDGIAWPFEFLLDSIVDNFLIKISWVWVVVLMFAIAWLVRNLSVAVGTATALIVCGLLGNDFWVQTARTIGFIVVAVIVCVIIGIPLGILSGRVDAVWQVMRPTLDAMQVIHAFVYLLPFVYFWGVGRVSATMATMVFALPPLIRLTNLGIRQVPEDVVEASRAYGATEMRVLRDVQLPLARPAIMTGINQTLLLAFSMLGIAAILGAGGMGALLFRALSQQDVNLAAAAGLGFFLLAVMLDRISQTEAGSKNLFSRISMAWKARKQPEVLLDDPEFNPAIHGAHRLPDEEETIVDEGVIAPIGSGERTAIGIAAIGAVLMVISLFLTWGTDGALITGYSRRVDQDLDGVSFSGLDAQGGSWFAFAMVGMALLVLGSCVRVLFRTGGGRWLSPDGAAIGAFGGLIVAFGYFVAQPSEFSEAYSHGIGVYVALVGGIVASVGAMRWLSLAPYGPRRPLKSHVVAGPIVLAGIALALAAMSMFSMWHLDERGDAVMTPELLAEIEAVKDAAEAGEIDPGVAATEIQVIRAKAQQAERIVLDGKSGDGVGLGTWTLVLSLLGTVGAVGTAGAFGLGDRRQWIAGALTIGAGAGVSGIAVGFIGSLARATDANYYSGVGAMFGLLAGALLFAAGNTVIKAFERSKVYRSTGSDISLESSGPTSHHDVDAVPSTVAT